MRKNSNIWFFTTIVLIAMLLIAAKITDNILRIGDNNPAVDKIIDLSDGIIKWNASANKLQFSNDAGGGFDDIAGAAGTLVELQNFTLIGNIGDVAQQNAGHLFLTDETGVGSDVALFLFGAASGLITDDEEGAFDLTNIGTTPEGAGIFGGGDGAAVFNGTTMRFSNATLLDVVPASLVIDFWFNADNGQPGGIQKLLVKSNIAASDRIFIDIQTNGKARILFEENNMGDLTLEINEALPSGATGWHYLVFSWGANGAALYFDGVLQNSLPSETTLLADGTNTDFFLAGNAGGTELFAGSLAMVRVRNVVLTQKDVDLGYATKRIIPVSLQSVDTFQMRVFVKEDGSDNFVSQITWGGIEVTRTNPTGEFLFTYGGIFDAVDKVKIEGTL